jgi:hypothetical protein
MVRDGGMVLLEAALAIPLLVAVALAGLGVARLAVDESAASRIRQWPRTSPGVCRVR